MKKKGIFLIVLMAFTCFGADKPVEDVKPIPLIISVRRVHNPDHDVVTEGRGRNRVRILGSTAQRDQRDQAFQINVQNGKSAFIQVGERFPIREQAIGFWKGFGVWAFNGRIRYEDLSSGLSVLPLVKGRQVSLIIAVGHEELTDDRTQLMREDNPIKSDSLETTLLVPLGQWSDVGRISTRDLPDQHTIVYDTADLDHPDINYYVKVEVDPLASGLNADFPRPAGP